MTFFYGPLYGHLPPILKIIQVRQTRHVGFCRRSKDKLISDVLLWTPTRPLTSHLKKIQVRQTRHAWLCRRSKDKLIINVLLWTPTRPLTSHLKKHPSKTNKTCGSMLEKQGQINVLQWTPTHGCTSVGWPVKTYLHQLCVDIRYSLEELSVMLDERDGWRERERVWEIRASRWYVAERTSYFCLVRNLIWPLGSPNIFTQSGWLILFSPDHLSEQPPKLGKAAKIFSFCLRTLQ